MVRAGGEAPLGGGHSRTHGGSRTASPWPVLTPHGPPRGTERAQRLVTEIRATTTVWPPAPSSAGAGPGGGCP